MHKNCPYIFFCVFFSILGCQNNTPQNIQNERTDVIKYDSLVGKISNINGMCGVEAVFMGRACLNLSFHIEDISQRDFFNAINPNVEEFSNLLFIEIGSKLSTLPKITNKKFGVLSLKYGIDTLLFDESITYFNQLHTLKTNNFNERIKYLKFSEKNNLERIYLVNAGISDISDFKDSIRNVTVLNLEGNEITFLGTLPFREGTKIYLKGNPIKDTSKTKLLNPKLFFEF